MRWDSWPTHTAWRERGTRIRGGAIIKLIRFIDAGGNVCTGKPTADGHARLLDGDLYGPHRITDRTSRVARLLAPIDPVNIIAIGLNYRRHAEECGMQIPNHPLVFLKLTTTVIAHEEPVILTGAPQGVGVSRKPAAFFRPGDTYSAEIEGVGELRNPVRADT